MKTKQPADPFLRHDFLKWYHVASVGQALQAVESSYLKSNLKLAYRQKTLQVGRLGSESRYIDPDFIGDYVLIDKKGPRSFPTFVQATAGSLPFATESIDTVVLPHVLEFVPDRHQVLREVERVLKPEGRLLILGLNPWSPRRLLQWPGNGSFWKARMVAGHHLLDWLSLIKFDAEIDPSLVNTRTKGQQKTETSWQALKSELSLAYAIKAIKRNYTLIPIEPEWSRFAQLVRGPLMETPEPSRRQQK
jgi:SAM-dependent methyltransferase